MSDRSATPRTDAAPTLDAAQRRYLPWVVALAFFMQTLDTTILNTALPGMARDLGENPLRMQSAVVAYMLTVALLIPASGWLADRLGTRSLFSGAIALFSLGSLACALSPSLGWLVAARVLQGVGGALLVPVGRLTVLRAFPREEFLPVMALVALPGLMGPLIGPALGGVLVEYASWHWIFLINLPIGLAGLLASRRLMPQLRSPARQPFDAAGFALFSLGLLLISVGLQSLGERMLGTALAGLLLLAGAACLAAYGLHAARIEAPLFNKALFGIASFRIGLIGNVFARLGSGATPFLTPMFLQLGLGLSPSRAGLCLVPAVLGAMATKRASTRLIQRAGYRRVLVVNTLMLGLLIASFALLEPDAGPWRLVAQMALFGVVNSMQFTAMNALTLIDLDAHTASSGNSLLSVVMQLSGSLGVASSGVLLLLFSGGQIRPGQGAGAAWLPAFQATYLAVGAMVALAAFIFFQLERDGGGRVSAPGNLQD